MGRRDWAMRLGLVAWSLALGALAIGSGAWAQEAWPARQVRVVVPFTAGGGADAVARAVAQSLTTRLGRPFVVDNRPGGAGNIGTEAVATAAADGYTLLLTGPSHINNAHLFQRLPFDPIGDFAPVSLLTSAPYLLVAAPALPVADFQALVALARASPGSLSYGSAGNGSAGHLAMELVKATTGIELLHVPYRGSPPMLADLMAGRIAVAFDNVLTASPGVAAGQLRALAVSGARRAPALPEVLTLGDSGLPGFAVEVWQGVFFPAGVAPAVVARLAGELRLAVQTPELRRRLAELGAEAIGAGPGEFGAFLAAEYARWGEVVRRTGARLD